MITESKPAIKRQKLTKTKQKTMKKKSFKCSTCYIWI